MLPRRDAQRLLWIEEDEPLKDQKIALLDQRVLSHQNGFLPDTDTHTGTYFLSEAGRGRETEIELGVARGIGVGGYCSWVFGGEITYFPPKSNWELEGILGLSDYSY